MFSNIAKKKIYEISSMLVIVLMCAANSASAQCHSDLSFLSSRIPQFNVPEIDAVRTAILNDNVVADMHKASSMGLSPQQAVQSSLSQADEYDRSAKEALETSNATRIDLTSDDAFLASVKSGNIGISRCDGVTASAMCAAVVGKLGAIASRAMAAEMGCFSSAGRWPN